MQPIIAAKQMGEIIGLFIIICLTLHTSFEFHVMLEAMSKAKYTPGFAIL